MGLTGKNNEEKAWNFLKGKIPNDFGVAGLMGELFAESGLNPQNLHLPNKWTIAPMISASTAIATINSINENPDCFFMPPLI